MKTKTHRRILAKTDHPTPRGFRKPQSPGAILQGIPGAVEAPMIPLAKDIEALVVLSAPSLKIETVYIEETPENTSRIRDGIELLKMLRESSGAPSNSLGLRPLILNGETEQLPMMQQVAIRHEYPPWQTWTVNCGDRGIGNTLTQFTAMRDDVRLQKVKRLAVVTTGYHVPRVRRTAKAVLPKECTVDVIGLPYPEYPFNVSSLVMGEMQRIIAYAEKGDFELFPK